MADGPQKTGNKTLDAALAHAWEHYFDGMVADIKAGKKPDWRKLERGVRSGNPIPKVVRDFMADVLAGKIKRPEGRPPVEFPECRDALYKMVFEFELKIIDRWGRIYNRPIPDRKNFAMERAADRLEVSKGAVDLAVYPRK